MKTARDIFADAIKAWSDCDIDDDEKAVDEGEKVIAAAIADARADEREQCAKVVSDHLSDCTQSRIAFDLPWVTAAIRRRGSGGQP